MSKEEHINFIERETEHIQKYFSNWIEDYFSQNELSFYDNLSVMEDVFSVISANLKLSRERGELCL